MVKFFDVAVVGLGAVGSAALHTLALGGARVVGIDRFAPPHNFGSSHGQSRIMRQAIGEGHIYVPLVLRSNEIIEALQVDCGNSLLERCGFLFITRDDEGTGHHGRNAFLRRTVSAATEFAIPHELLDANTLSARFPHFQNLHGDEHAYFEPGGGYLRPEACIEAFLNQARIHGALIQENTKVTHIDPCKDRIRVITENGEIETRHAILATGAWLPELAPRTTKKHLVIYRQTLHWFPVIDNSCYRDGPFPTFIWTHGATSADQFYGFPPLEGAIKVAAEQYAVPHNPNDFSQITDPDEKFSIANFHVAGRIAGVAAMPNRSEPCFYAATPDLDFLIDHESDGRIQIVSACSGHGFKHAPAIGEAVGYYALKKPYPIDLKIFSKRRFATRL